MNIGVIVHGPGIIDSGYALKLIKVLSNYGHISAKLGGTMGRTAVIDASLEDVIDIKDKLLPSQSVKILSKDNDVLFLLNYGKSTITGHTFGYKVYNNSDNPRLVQIERPGEEDGCIIKWNESVSDKLVQDISKQLNLPIISGRDAANLVKDKTGYKDNDEVIERKVAGVSSGENIMLNGIIIGRATSDDLTIISENNQITEMKGGTIKPHGLEKLGKVDLSKAIIKTGLLRKSEKVKPRIIKKDLEENTAVYLNHAAEDIFQYNNHSVIVSIGDDTTLLSSDILYRFNIPIIGITDGDLDKVVTCGFKLSNSLIIQVESGYDDIIGNLIYEKIFHKNNIIKIKSIEKLREDIISLIKGENIDYKFVEKQLD